MTGTYRSSSALVTAVIMLTVGMVRADQTPSFAGPAMGTTYRVTLARDLPAMTVGEVHREVEQVLARIDVALSTWREDSAASRFNRAPTGEWVEAASDLVAVVEIARGVHEASRGAFDITVAPAGSGQPVGLRHVDLRLSPPSLRKTVAGIRLDLSGIGPGYAVDTIGGRLVELGSTGHLVELGGEVRAWGRRPDGSPWRVHVRPRDTAAEGADVIELADGAAIATSTAKPGRSPVDPRTGRVATGSRTSATVRATSCAVADAWAVAAMVLDLSVDEDGFIRRATAD